MGGGGSTVFINGIVGNLDVIEMIQDWTCWDLGLRSGVTGGCLGHLA